jgi:hypothetical protein
MNPMSRNLNLNHMNHMCPSLTLMFQRSPKSRKCLTNRTLQKSTKKCQKSTKKCQKSTKKCQKSPKSPK